MGSRTLEEQGPAVAPRDEPLTYPGGWPADSSLLDGGRLLYLGPDTHPDGPVFAGRVPVLAVGSNASPGQLRLKPTAAGLASPLPLARTRVHGLDVGARRT